MTTNYGARPGLTVEPRTMSAEQEAQDRGWADCAADGDQRYALVRESQRRAHAELDAERAAHAATLAALDDILYESGWRSEASLSAATERERNTTLWLVARIAATALAQARGSQSKGGRS